MRLACLAIVLALTAGCASTSRPSAAPRSAAPPAPLATTGTANLAIANLSAASGTLVSGRLFLRPAEGGVRITGTLGGLPRKSGHGLQVHERGDCSAVDARSAGAPFEPLAPGQAVGGRILSDAKGVAEIDLLLPGVVLGGGARNDIAGRALVVLGPEPGPAPARRACGVIRVQP